MESKSGAGAGTLAGKVQIFSGEGESESAIKDQDQEYEREEKKGLAADAKEVGVRNPAEENVLPSRPKIFEGQKITARKIRHQS